MSGYDTFKAGVLGDPYDPDKKPSRALTVQGIKELQLQVDAVETSGALGYPNYATTAEGIAATSDGESFTVLEADYLVIYENVAEVAVERGKIPLDSAFEDALASKADQTDLDATNLIVADKVDEDELDLTNETFANFESLIQNFSSIQKLFGMSSNNLGAVFALALKDMSVPFYVKGDGSFFGAGTNFEVLDDNNLGLSWAVVDADNRVLIGFDKSKGFWLNGKYYGSLGKNNLDLIDILSMDADNKPLLGLKSDGGLYASFNESCVFIENDDVYEVLGTEKNQLTTSGDCSAPFNVGNGKVRFISTRRGGVPLQFEMNKAAVGTEYVAYSEHKEYEVLIVTGQSLAQGGANPAETIVPPYPKQAFRLENGPIASNGEILGTDLEPLREEVYETISTSYARNRIENGFDKKLIVTGAAWGGKAYADIKKRWVNRNL